MQIRHLSGPAAMQPWKEQTMNSALLTPPTTADSAEENARETWSAETAGAPARSAVDALPAVPLADAAASRSMSASEPRHRWSESETAVRTRSVVIVEDQGITTLQIRRGLTNAGMTILGDASNGRSGVELVLRERPDIVLMDIRMPEMDGLEAARAILRELRTCVVMLTAFATPEYEAISREIGAHGFVGKPIESRELLLRMDEAWQAFEAG
ncbi:MAG TPA: response regulator [Chthonomonadaceae bacterium]|nr:response regulator [Chthonomonadaceae bacterium]